MSIPVTIQLKRPPSLPEKQNHFQFMTSTLARGLETSSRQDVKFQITGNFLASVLLLLLLSPCPRLSTVQHCIVSDTEDATHDSVESEGSVQE